MLIDTFLHDLCNGFGALLKVCVVCHDLWLSLMEGKNFWALVFCFSFEKGRKGMLFSILAACISTMFFFIKQCFTFFLNACLDLIWFDFIPISQYGVCIIYLFLIVTWFSCYYLMDILYWLIWLTQAPSFPKEASRLNDHGNLPLHMACSFQATPNVIDALLHA